LDPEPSSAGCFFDPADPPIAELLAKLLLVMLMAWPALPVAATAPPLSALLPVKVQLATVSGLAPGPKTAPPPPVPVAELLVNVQLFKFSAFPAPGLKMAPPPPEPVAELLINVVSKAFRVAPAATSAIAPPPPVLTPSPMPTVLPPQTAGPEITHFGVATADDRPLQPDTNDAQGRPVFSRPFGQGMTLVIEARPGQNGNSVALTTYSQTGAAPDLQVLVSQPLGDGNPAVCEQGGHAGGVPAVPTLDFTGDPTTVAAINDLGCRAIEPSPGFACTRAASGSFAVVNPASTIQFCIPIAKAWAFPAGDTIAAARVRDAYGNPGEVQEIVVRVAE